VIERDVWGVPHVSSESEAAAFFGLGYAQAEDQLPQILKSYLSVSGRQAEAFGKASVPADTLMLRWRFLEEARLGYRRLERADPQFARDLVAFEAGIGKYLADHPGKRPEWAPELEPALPLALWMVGTWALEHARGWETGGLADCARGGIAIESGPDFAYEWKPPRFPNGSNEWALAPWRVADHVAVAVADPHGGFGGSSMEWHVHAGTLHFMGFGIPGTPIPYTGHNEYLGWGTTVGGPDVADCYEIEASTTSPDRYRFDNDWRSVTRRTVTIKVKGEPPTAVTLEYVRVNGITVPVIARKAEKLYVAVGTLDNLAEGPNRHLYQLFKARNVREWLSALEPMQLFPVNLVGADVDGNIFYLRAGRVPVRPGGFDWTRPVPGNSSASEWKGIHGTKDLIQLVNPPQGYLVNANNSPDTMFPTPVLTSEKYPIDIFNAESGRSTSRSALGLELLPPTLAATHDDLVSILYNEQWLNAMGWVHALSQAVAVDAGWLRDAPPEIRVLVDRILHFDGQAHRESRAALAYFHWQQATAAEIKSAGIDWHALDATAAARRSMSERELDVLRSGVVRAQHDMQTLYGTADPQFGDIFRIGRGGVSLPIGGCTGPSEIPAPDWRKIELIPPLPFRSGKCANPDDSGKRVITEGQADPILMIMHRPIETYSAQPFGQCDEPGCPHYSDQSVLYSERRMKPTYFHANDLAGHVESTTRLNWNGGP
jgi:acyl-homoserine lactone acylase PvdQ